MGYKKIQFNEKRPVLDRSAFYAAESRISEENIGGATERRALKDVISVQRGKKHAFSEPFLIFPLDGLYLLAAYGRKVAAVHEEIALLQRLDVLQIDQITPMAT